MLKRLNSSFSFLNGWTVP